jgi:hypothetical protein
MRQDRDPRDRTRVDNAVSVDHENNIWRVGFEAVETLVLGVGFALQGRSCPFDYRRPGLARDRRGTIGAVVSDDEQAIAPP